MRRTPTGRYSTSSPCPPPRVGPAANTSGRFDVLPPDVADKLARALGRSHRPASGRPFLLVVRRVRETLNSTGPGLPGLPRTPYNPLFVHPDDLAELGVDTGDVVTVASDHGEVTAVVAADGSMRRGAVSMTHGFGGLPGDGDPLRVGANPGRLLSTEFDLQGISAMPLMSAVPVTLTAGSGEDRVVTGSRAAAPARAASAGTAGSQLRGIPTTSPTNDRSTT